MVNCTRCQHIIRREIDGTTCDRQKCVNGMANTFRQAVSEDTCSKCILKQTWDCLCALTPPSSPILDQPTLGCNNEIIYSNGQPPCPYGYHATDDPLKFESDWPGCTYMEFSNELNEDGSVKIKARCAITHKLVSPQTCNNCAGDVNSITPKEYPALATELTNYVHAVKDWVAKGRPVRTDEEIIAIHTQYCVQCDWYDVDQQRCKGCGCKTRAEGAALLNKIKMSTQHCPKQLW